MCRFSVPEWLKHTWDYIVVAFGIAAMLLSFLNPVSSITSILCTVAGVLGCLYIIIGFLFGILSRAKFDWYLVNGNYILKILAVVLLTPFALSLFIGNQDVQTQELIFDDNLYCQDSAVDTLCIEYKDSLNVALPLYGAGNDTLLLAKSNLPDSISDRQSDPPLYWGVYYHFIDPGNQHMTTTEQGRLWAALIAILGVFLLNGLLVSSIVGWVDSRKERWQKGESRYKGLLNHRKHYVVIGGNAMVQSVVEQLLKRDTGLFRPYILIQTMRDVESFRRELFSTLTPGQQRRVIIYYGSMTSKVDVEELPLRKAEEVYVLGEDTRTDDIESYHDTMNMECLRLLNEKYAALSPSSSGSLICRVMFEYQSTFSVFQFSDIERIVDFRPFNYYEMWAQKVLVNRELDRSKLSAAAAKGGYLPLEGCERIDESSDRYVHLFVVGMSRMGIAMAIEAAHLAHYPNYEKKNIRTKITFIDKNAKEEKDFLIGRFKELFSLSHWRYGDAEVDGLWIKENEISGYGHLGGDFIDIEWEFINGGIEQSAVQDYMLSSAVPEALITVAVCLPEANAAHTAAMYLPKDFYASESLLQILVYNCHGDSIIRSLTTATVRHPYLNKLKPFGRPERCFDSNFLTQSEIIGAAVGERYNEIKHGYIDPAKEGAGQVDKCVAYKGKSLTASSWSNIYNGNMMWTKLRSVDYDENKGLTDGQKMLLSDVEHNRWNIEQLLMHFRPLTEKEQQEVIDRIKDKDELKGEMAHLNICSNKRLLELSCVDVAARAYDEGLTGLLPEIYARVKEELND